MCSHHIPFISSQVVPQDIPNSTSVLSYKVCPKFNSHVYKLKSYVIGEHISSYFVTGVQKVLLFRSTQYSQKQFGDGPINPDSFKTKNKSVSAHMNYN